MAELISIKIDTRKVENMLNGYQRTIPRAADKMSKKIARMYATMYLTQLPRSRISPFTGHSFTMLQSQTTNPIRLGKNSYGVAVPEYLVGLDRMPPHWVSLKRRPMLRRWVETKIQNAAKANWFVSHRKVHVNPHPWIRSAHIRAGKNVRSIAEFEINKALRAKGR